MAEIDYDEIRKLVHLTYVTKMGTWRIIDDAKGYLGEIHPNISEYGIVAVLNPRDFELILQEAVENIERKVKEAENDEEKFKLWNTQRKFENVLKVVEEFIQHHEKAREKYESSLVGKISKKLGID